MTEKKFDIYETITDRICAELEKGQIPWNKPWFGKADGAISGSTGRPYSLLNQMLLMKAGQWFTYNQANALGAQVRKGEKSSIVVFWKQLPITETNEKGEEIKKTIPMLKYFHVFHESQIDGLPEQDQRPSIEHIDPHAEAEAIVNDYVARSGLKLNRDEVSSEAFYRPSCDSVTVPRMDQFASQSEYYSTLFHELVHSTGHKSRLNRLTSTAHFGNEEYSKEELVAEIGAAALNNHCGIETDASFRNSAAYIQSWLKALKDDKRLLVSASSRAEKAYNLILGIA